jgi:hypothetical protein
MERQRQREREKGRERLRGAYSEDRHRKKTVIYKARKDATNPIETFFWWSWD